MEIQAQISSLFSLALKVLESVSPHRNVFPWEDLQWVHVLLGSYDPSKNCQKKTNVFQNQVVSSRFGVCCGFVIRSPIGGTVTQNGTILQAPVDQSALADGGLISYTVIRFQTGKISTLKCILLEICSYWCLQMCAFFDWILRSSTFWDQQILQRPWEGLVWIPSQPPQ